MENRTLFNIGTKELSPNPYNPRMVFDPDELEELKKSIRKVGILVPLTVYLNKKNHPPTKYILLDGERRWRCAKELGMEFVPANIIDEPEDITQNILFMFNIHHFRKEWALFPTALKLEVIIEKLGTEQESVLSEFTGVSRSMIRRCKILLWFPHKYRDVLMEKSAKISTDFFIELYPIANRLSNEEDYYYPEGTIKILDGFIKKFVEYQTFTDVKEIRDIRKAMAFFDNKNNINGFIDLLTKFLDEPRIGLEIFTTADIEEEKTRQNILRYISFLNSSFETINPDLISDFFFVDQLKQLEKNVKTLLDMIE